MQILKSLVDSEFAKKNSMKKNSSSKASKDDSSEESSHSSDGESEELEDEVKPKKRIAPKGITKNCEGLKKRNMPEIEAKAFIKKRIKLSEAEDSSDAEDDEHVSEGSQSQSSAEKPIKVSSIKFSQFLDIDPHKISLLHCFLKFRRKMFQPQHMENVWSI